MSASARSAARRFVEQGNTVVVMSYLEVIKRPPTGLWIPAPKGLRQWGGEIVQRHTGRRSLRGGAQLQPALPGKNRNHAALERKP